MNSLQLEKSQNTSDSEISNRVVIGESKFGLGVFSNSELKIGEVIRLCRLDDIIKTKIETVPQDKRKYLQYIDDVWCFAPKDLDSPAPAWLVNHSVDPNMLPVGGGEYKITRHIATGQELFIDYRNFDEPANLRDEFYK